MHICPRLPSSPSFISCSTSTGGWWQVSCTVGEGMISKMSKNGQHSKVSLVGPLRRRQKDIHSKLPRLWTLTLEENAIRKITKRSDINVLSDYKNGQATKALSSSAPFSSFIFEQKPHIHQRKLCNGEAKKQRKRLKFTSPTDSTIPNQMNSVESSLAPVILQPQKSLFPSIMSDSQRV